MKELTNEQLDGHWDCLPGIKIHNEATAQGIRTEVLLRRAFARAAISADRALNAADRKLELLQQAHDRSHAEALRLAEKLRKYESENAMHLNSAPQGVAEMMKFAHDLAGKKYNAGYQDSAKQGSGANLSYMGEDALAKLEQAVTTIVQERDQLKEELDEIQKIVESYMNKNSS